MKWFFLRKPPDITEFDFDPNTDGLSLEATEYMKWMADRFHLMRKIVLDRKIRDQETRYIKELRKNPDYKGFAIGDLVYLDAQHASDLKIPSQKLNKKWIGPVKIQGIIDGSHYMISDWQSTLPCVVIHANRLKPCHINIGKVDQDEFVTVSTFTRTFQTYTRK